MAKKKITKKGLLANIRTELTDKQISEMVKLVGEIPLQKERKIKLMSAATLDASVIDIRARAVTIHAPEPWPHPKSKGGRGRIDLGGPSGI